MSDNKILVSIIIPYFKKKLFILKTINSVLKQSHKNLEIIIIYDDTDLSDLKFLKKIIKKNKHTKIYQNKRNMGVGYSRNKGIRLAKGKYLAFLDADDLWKKNKLQYQLRFMKKKRISFSYTSYDEINEIGKKIKTNLAPSETKFHDLLKDCKIGLSTVMLDRKLIGNKCKFPNLRTKEDLVLWLKISKKTNLIGCKKNLSQWRSTKNSLSSNTMQKIFDGFKVYYVYMQYNFFKSILYLFILSINYIKKRI